MKFIIPVLVGAIIGYITNWLAIKMLFRPYNEKKFLGVHIPFTPGLIPKEKSRIAKSVGETIGVHLLSPEIVTEALASDKMSNQIRAWIEHNINSLKQSDKTIKTFLISMGDENYNKLLNSVEKKFTDFICFQLRTQRFKDKVMDLIENKVFDHYSDDFYKIIKEKVELLMEDISSSVEIKEALKNAIDDKINKLEYDQRTLNEIIPDNVVRGFKQYINEHSEDIGNALREMFENPLIKIKIKDSIVELVFKNVNKVITMFMSPELISEKIFKAIENYINNPQVDENIALIINVSIDKLLQSKISNIASDVSSKINDEDISKVSDFILSYISNKENQGKILGIMEEKMRSSESDIKEKLLGFISEKLVDTLSSQELYENVLLIVQSIIEMLINKPISSMLENIDKTTIISVTNFSKNIFSNFAKSKLPYIVEQINISKVVEDQINSFDVAFAEEIIIEIANKELKAITWLGALLGGIMGILSPLLQLLYK
ncbi:DUF445 domain-containing protein [Tissierella sp. MSJ-40]|uniref:DUF445 domain-containing protein n=1 Tax=Tissierella simiarum TaxID=2841534 RepID=A0ABS6E389_9FIRM|nr:DUF445 family protein [Tissierella simiarum]MBU5437291.1 DUF445 domain-containing protein [Tissierella simiarum]